MAICEYGEVGLALALGKVMYNDDDRTFQQWHEEIKGGKSRYELERIQRGAWSRLRKVCFGLQHISFIRLTDGTLVKCGSFQRDFRNSNGKFRHRLTPILSSYRIRVRSLIYHKNIRARPFEGR